MEITAESNPHTILDAWLKEASQHKEIREPTAMALATVAADGAVHNRIVLCKSWTNEGLAFYTNYLSQKGQELDRHPFAGAVFYWEALQRQVRVSGPVRRLPAEESSAYWGSRPRDSQLSGFISRQSEPVGSRAVLENLWHEAEARYSGREIPCPENWGGYLMSIQSIEFWIGRPGRLHDRFSFEKSNKGWTFRRLFP